MGQSCGKSTREGEENKGGKKRDDEDLIKEYHVDRGWSGGRSGTWYSRTIQKVRTLERLKKGKMPHRHRTVHKRRAEVVVDDSLGVIDIVPAADESNEYHSGTEPVASPTVKIPTTPTLSIVSSGTSSYSARSTGVTEMPIGNTRQTVLSSTPPPSPVESASGSSIPTIVKSSTETRTTPPTTITSSLTLRSNGTIFSNTLSTANVTTDGTVIVFTFPTATSQNYTRLTTLSTGYSRGPSSYTGPTNISSIPSATSLWPSSTGSGGGGGGGGDSGGGAVSTTSALFSSPTSTGDSAQSGAPVSPKILGGVLGGVAGLALLLWLILYLIRRRKRALEIQARDDAGYGGALGTGGDGDGDQSITQRSSVTPFAAAGGFFSRHSRQSRASQASETPPIPEERGFYKVSGRKLPPVIGGPRPDYASNRSVAGSSVYHEDEIAWTGVPGTPVSSSGGGGPPRFSGMTATSASPGVSSGPSGMHTSIGMASSSPMGTAPVPAIIQEEEVESSRETTPKAHRPHMFPRQMSALSVVSKAASKDGVGRSLPSHDGSRASKFTEDIG